MSPTKDELHRHLAPFEQEHVLAFWDELTPAQQQQLVAELSALDLPQLRELFHGQQAAEDWAAVAGRAMAPPAFRLRDRRAAVSAEQAEQAGQRALAAGQVGVVVVAGGQGSRLGFEHPKGMFPIGPISGAPLFQILFEKIAARSRAAGMRIPLYLMTSPATHDETVAYLAEQRILRTPQRGRHHLLPGDDAGHRCRHRPAAVGRRKAAWP